MNFDVKFSTDFNLSQLVRSSTAQRLGITEQLIIPHEVVHRLANLCEWFLQPFSGFFGVPIITSGYRCPALNKAIGGVPTSQHVKGEAVDFVPVNRGDGVVTREKVWKKLQEMNVDQAIIYDTFFHVSWKFHGNRQQYIDKRTAKQNTNTLQLPPDS